MQPAPRRGLLHVGELTIDDVVVEDIGSTWKQPGGGALYSAVGAMVWHCEVAVAAAVGEDYPENLLRDMAFAGVDVASVERVPGLLSIGLWLLYESQGQRRQLEKVSGGSMRDLDQHRARLPDVATLHGVHLAPQSSQGHRGVVDQLVGTETLRTLDLMVEPYIDCAPYLDGSLLRHVDAFLPSLQEVRDLWSHDDVGRLADELRNLGVTAHLVVKQGPAGVDVVVEGSVVRVPSVVVDLVDPTGAGDAFCGGFLAGLVDTGDPVEAAVFGVVSASFVCQTRGPLAAISQSDPATALDRAQVARRGTRKVS